MERLVLESRGRAEPPAWWVSSLQLFDHPDFTPALEAARTKLNTSAWQTPVLGLVSRLGSVEAAQSLVFIAHDRDARTADAALAAYGEALDATTSRLTSEHRDALRDHARLQLRHARPERRAAAALALSRDAAALDDDDRGRAQSILLEAFLRARRPQEKTGRARALGRVGDERVISPLEGVLRDENFDLREAAARARHHAWSRRYAADPAAAPSGRMDDDFIMVPARFDEESYYDSGSARIDRAIQEGLVRPIGPFAIDVPEMEGSIVKSVTTKRYAGDPALAADLRRRGIDPKWVFLVPMRDPRKAERYSKVHGRSFFTETPGGGAVFKNVGGVKVETIAGRSVLFDAGNHGTGKTPAHAAMVSTLIDRWLAEGRHQPSVRLAASFGAGRDIALEHVAGFKPLAVPVAREGMVFPILTPVEDLARAMPGFEPGPVYLYRAPLAVRTEEMGSMRDSALAAADWIGLLPGGRPAREAAQVLLENVAARKGLLSYLFHIAHELPLGWPEISSGNQVLSTHNKNPLTHFDMDTVYWPARVVEWKEKLTPRPLIQLDRTPRKSDWDPKPMMDRHIAQEIAWLVRDIELIADDLILSAREARRAVSLYFHVLLADELVAPAKKSGKKRHHIDARTAQEVFSSSTP
ncbi:MAG: hypothetical protein HYZ74_08075 [Elusimicrobia bacterium]|nr:hypothetical protein [Elusimicrobiota bacterium]